MIERRVPCRPYFLIEWQNSLGGWEQWAFQRQQEILISPPEESTIYETYTPDIEVSYGSIGRAGMESQFEITGYDDQVLRDDIGWLHEMKQSRSVKVIFPSGESVNAAVVSTSTAVNSRNKLSTFSVRVRLPRNVHPLLVGS